MSSRGIEANPDKLQAVLDMKPPRTVKEVQRLAGYIAALGPFMSRSTDKCQPFLHALRQWANFSWDQPSIEDLHGSAAQDRSPLEGEILVL